MLLSVSVVAVLVVAPLVAQAPPNAAPADSGWRIAPAAHADLWFHAMAVIGADDPGPLGLYNAEYAQMIREVKRRAGVYPTALDRAGPGLRRQLSDTTLGSIHFLPLYFPDATPDSMLDAVSAAAMRRGGPMRPDAPLGGLVVAQLAQDGRARETLLSLVEAVREEWQVFYRDYWARAAAERAALYTAMQGMWDDKLAAPLKPFLQRRRLTAGRVMPSPPVGPEGRITEQSDMLPDDQAVAVQLPPSATGPEASVFAFLKELCFLVIDDERLRRAAPAERDFEDLQRRAAVRCGALILEFYAPLMAASYRRVFLDAVGAEESATVRAFERVYPLPPAAYEELREAIRER